MAPDPEPVVVRQEGVLGGRPSFRGTRVQAEILFENLADGCSIEEIADSYPTLAIEDLRAAILQAGWLIMDAAPIMSDLDVDHDRVAARARLPR